MLAALIDEALHANTSLRGARAGLDPSRALGEVQSAALLPALNGSASARASRIGQAGSIGGYRVGFDASWEPDIFGGQRAAAAASEADTQARVASLVLRPGYFET